MTALSESFTPLLPPPFPPHHTAPQPTPPSPLGILGVGLDSVTIFKIEMCLKKYYPSYNYRRKRSLDNELAWERQFLCIYGPVPNAYGMSSLFPPAGDILKISVPVYKYGKASSKLHIASSYGASL